MHYENELTDDELRKKVLSLKTVSDLSVGKYETIIIIVSADDRWKTKTIKNSSILEVEKQKIIKISDSSKRPILLKIREKILRDHNSDRDYYKDTKVLVSFGHSVK